MLRYRRLLLGLVVAALTPLVAVGSCTPGEGFLVRSRSSGSNSGGSSDHPVADDSRLGASRPDQSDDGSDDGSEPGGSDDGSETDESDDASEPDGSDDAADDDGAV